MVAALPENKKEAVTKLALIQSEVQFEAEATLKLNLRKRLGQSQKATIRAGTEKKSSNNILHRLLYVYSLEDGETLSWAYTCTVKIRFYLTIYLMFISPSSITGKQEKTFLMHRRGNTINYITG